MKLLNLITDWLIDHAGIRAAAAMLSLLLGTVVFTPFMFLGFQHYAVQVLATSLGAYVGVAIAHKLFR